MITIRFRCKFYLYTKGFQPDTMDFLDCFLNIQVLLRFSKKKDNTDQIGYLHMNKLYSSIDNRKF